MEFDVDDQSAVSDDIEVRVWLRYETADFLVVHEDKLRAPYDCCQPGLGLL